MKIGFLKLMAVWSLIGPNSAIFAQDNSENLMDIAQKGLSQSSDWVQKQARNVWNYCKENLGKVWGLYQGQNTTNTPLKKPDFQKISESYKLAMPKLQSTMLESNQPNRDLPIPSPFTKQSPEAPAVPQKQPAQPMVFSFDKCTSAIYSGLLGISTIPEYLYAFGAASMINGLQRIFELKINNDCNNFTKCVRGVLAGVSIYSGLCGFSNFFTFHQNCTNLAQLCSAIDLIKRPSLSGAVFSRIFGTGDINHDNENALFKNGLRIGDMTEICIKFIVMAPLLVKTLPIAYALIMERQ
jgi:hypothetical protein